MILFSLLRNLFRRPSRIEEHLTRMETQMSRVTQTLLAINDQLNKAAEEIISRIAELQTRDYLTDEDKAILSRIKDGAQTLDDIVPDEVVEEAEEEQGAEAPEEDESDTVDEKTTPDEVPEEETTEDEVPADEDESTEEEGDEASTNA